MAVEARSASAPSTRIFFIASIRIGFGRGFAAGRTRRNLAAPARLTIGCRFVETAIRSGTRPSGRGGERRVADRFRETVVAPEELVAGHEGRRAEDAARPCF